jgi:hypothetical protein
MSPRRLAPEKMALRPKFENLISGRRTLTFGNKKAPRKHTFRGNGSWSGVYKGGSPKGQARERRKTIKDCPIKDHLEKWSE